MTRSIFAPFGRALGRADSRRPSDGELALFPERNPRPVLLLSRDGDPLYANPACRHTLARFGREHGSAVSILPPDLRRRLEVMRATQALDARFDYSLAGRTFSCSLQVLPERDLVHAYLSDVTEERRAAGELAQARRQDGLTRLGNRLSFEDRLEQALADRRGGFVALLLLDVDRLRRINDGLGHALGDALLQDVAQRLRRTAHETDGAAAEAFRFQGDAFAVLAAALDSDAAPARLAQALRQAMSIPFKLGGTEVFATASIGVAVAPQDGSDVSVLLRNAQSALDHVKQDGGNAFRCYSAGLDAMARRWLELESGLHRAVERRELSLVYQPQVDLVTRMETAHEALLRWNRPGADAVPPSEFIPVAEESRLIGRIGAWVLDAACREAGAPNGWTARVAVNVSARQFHEPDFPKLVSRVLAETSLEPRRLELEITESVAMTDTEATAEVLARLKDVGVSLAIDDFGTGYSSLAYLARFPIDRLKLDRSFVQRIGQRPADEAVVRAVIEVGARLHMRVLAEGVDTEERLARLREWGCDEGQGYLFGAPAPPPKTHAAAERAISC